MAKKEKENNFDVTKVFNEDFDTISEKDYRKNKWAKKRAKE